MAGCAGETCVQTGSGTSSKHDLIQLFKSGAQSLGATLLVEAPAEA